MEELTNEKQAYIFLIQLLDTATTRGAFNRTEVLQYNNALGILDKIFQEEKEPSNE